MKSIIVGGGKIGYNLLKTLRDRGNQVAMIERDDHICSKIAEDIDAEVFYGDGTDPEVLRDSGIEDADVVAAVTGTDEENLVICLIAKTYFQINKTIARVNNPKNIAMFKALGVDKTVCSTEVIANLIEYEVDRDDYRIVQVLDRGSMILAEITIGDNNPWKNNYIKNIELPAECVIASIQRDGKAIYPRGNTQILDDDNILIITNYTALGDLKNQLKKRRP